MDKKLSLAWVKCAKKDFFAIGSKEGREYGEQGASEMETDSEGRPLHLMDEANDALAWIRQYKSEEFSGGVEAYSLSNREVKLYEEGFKKGMVEAVNKHFKVKTSGDETGTHQTVMDFIDNWDLSIDTWQNGARIGFEGDADTGINDWWFRDFKSVADAEAWVAKNISALEFALSKWNDGEFGGDEELANQKLQDEIDKLS